MVRISCIALLLVVMGCGSESAPFKIQMSSLLHDDSSKAWMVKSEKINGEEFSPDNQNFKTVIVFYNDFTYSEQPLNTMGNRPPKYGTFEIGNQNGTVTFVLDRKEHVFQVKSYSKQEVELISASEELKTVLLLVPLPKL